MLVPFQDTPVEVEQNTELPDYLPEDESPTKEQDKAVSRVGSHPEGGASWLSTAANFLSRSFYWWLQFGSQGLCELTRGQFSIVVVNCQVQFAISYHEKFLDYMIAYAAFYILLDVLPCSVVKRTEATGGVPLFMKVFWFCFPLIASLFKKHGSTVKPNTYMCSFKFYFTWSTWLGKLVFSSSLRTYLKRSFCLFVLAQVVHELLNIFLCFSSWKILAWVLFTESWKHFSLSPSCAFFILPTMFIERTLL